MKNLRWKHLPSGDKYLYGQTPYGPSNVIIRDNHASRDMGFSVYFYVSVVDDKVIAQLKNSKGLILEEIVVPEQKYKTNKVQVTMLLDIETKEEETDVLHLVESMEILLHTRNGTLSDPTIINVQEI